MKRIGLVVAYDGTNYCGWQTQPNGITVQGVLMIHFLSFWAKRLKRLVPAVQMQAYTPLEM